MLSLSLSCLCPAGDTVQPTADGTANFPLFLHPTDELHPLRPAQLSISSEDPPEAACQSPRPSPDGRRWASIPLPPGLWVSSQPCWGWGADLHLEGCQRGQVNGMSFVDLCAPWLWRWGEGIFLYLCPMSLRTWNRCGGEPGLGSRMSL